METTAMIIAIVSLVVGGAAYWRAGGQRDVELMRKKLSSELESLLAKQKELSEALLATIEEAYAESRQALHQTSEGLQHLKNEAIEGLEQQIERAAQQLRVLERRLEESLKSAGQTTAATAHRIELALRRRVRRLEARGSLLYAKAAAVLASRYAQKEDFQRAEKRLDEATALLALARETMRADHVHDEQLESVKLLLAEATTAVRAKAQDMRQRMEQVLSATDKLVTVLESDEQQAAERKSA